MCERFWTVPRAEPLRLRSTMAYSVVGEKGLYREQARTAAVIADERSRVYRRLKTALEDMEREDPILRSSLHVFVIRTLADRLNLATLETDALQR